VYSEVPAAALVLCSTSHRSDWVVLLGVVMPTITSLLAADFAKLAWVRFHPVGDIFLPRLEEPVVTG
jgi:hypothetical protein